MLIIDNLTISVYSERERKSSLIVVISMSRKVSKRIISASKIFEGKSFSFKEAISVFLSEYKDKFSAKINETVECSILLGVDPKRSDQMVRGAVILPKGLGKQLKVMAILNDEHKAEAIEAGAAVAGGQSLIDEILADKIDLGSLDVCVGEEKMMMTIAKVAKKLGSRGLMPNLKLGTVVHDVPKRVREIKNGMVEFKVEKGALIHAPIGKLNFSAEALSENMKALYDALVTAKPVASKGIYIKKCHISVTYGPSATIDVKSLAQLAS
ncbi:50S ribosomal protein L1 [Candidatus Fokinia crypta]|uniref:Large ribosomal subunit protein uL1 n=1 Tax=Candidatus Fokinia crypta TaxID=1920990 RepID=A0ABZ0UTV3_9RICK|nr:50S ribosomal protein L1 [Candidatus Fokinia cryptica]WPX98113.1 50S ribosomal protein L1 [Candidatus Fokinia cryptica]